VATSPQPQWTGGGGVQAAQGASVSIYVHVFALLKD